MPAETVPKTLAGQPEQTGLNPSDFRTPLAYETNGGGGSPPETPVAPEVTGPVALPEAASFREEAIADGSGAAPTPPGTRIEVVDASDSSDTDELSPELQERYNDYAVGVRAHGIEAPSSAEWIRVHKPAEATPELGFSVEPDAVAGEPVVPKPKIPQVTPEVVVPLEPEATTPPAGEKPPPLTVEAPAPEPAPIAPEAATTPAPETPPATAEAPAEEPPVEAETELVAEEGEEAPITKENLQMLRFLPERSRGWVMDQLTKIGNQPKVKRFVGKLRITYSEHFVEKHQQRVVEAKDQVNGYEIELKAIDRAILVQEQQVARMKAAGTPGYEGLQVSIQEMGRERAKVLARKDKERTGLAARDEELRVNVNKRDAIADEVIQFFEQRLGPIEEEMQRLQTARNHVELCDAVVEAEVEEKLLGLEQDETAMREIAEALRASGKSERAIERITMPRARRKEIQRTYIEIDAARKSIRTQKAILDVMLAEINARYNPLADIREEFKRVKSIRPVENDLLVRELEAEFTGREEIDSALRPEAEGDPTTYPDLTHPGRGEAGAATTETGAETEHRTTVTERIETYNSGVADDRKIDLDDFLAATRITRDRPYSEEKFKKILKSYLVYRGREGGSTNEG